MLFALNMICARLYGRAPLGERLVGDFSIATVPVAGGGRVGFADYPGC